MADAAYAELVERVSEAIRGASADVLARGLATLEVEPGSDDGDVPAILTLSPVNPSASPVVVQIDHESQLTLYLGAHGTICELWERDTSELLDWAKRYVRAVIDGSYRERVRPGADPGDTRAAGELDIGEKKPVRILSQMLIWRLARGPEFKEYDYEAYNEGAPTSSEAPEG